MDAGQGGSNADRGRPSGGTSGGGGGGSGSPALSSTPPQQSSLTTAVNDPLTPSRRTSPLPPLGPRRASQRSGNMTGNDDQKQQQQQQLSLPAGARPPAPRRRPSNPASVSTTASPAAASPGLSPAPTRSISFKRRYTSGAHPSDAASNPNRLSAFIHRASFGALGAPATPIAGSPSQYGGGAYPRRPPRKSFAAASAAGSDAVARWRNMRRVHTLSVHPPISGDPEDPSSWAFPEPKPQIPSILPNTNAPDATPIPAVPFAVLCLVCFGEFSSAGVAGPFLFFMIEGFNVGGEAEVGYWAGIIASAFFFTQFLTSLLWSSIADKYGRRAVLLTSLCGNALTLVAFGTSTNLKMALTVRMAQGLFNGAVGVAKGAIRDLTDPTNEGRAYALLGFCWGMGGIVGPIAGGLLEHPAEKFPWLFGNVELFKTTPYLLPCLVGASFTTLGAFLSLFIGPDGGPRQSGQIKLEGPEESLAHAAPTPRNPLVAAAEGVGSNLDSLGRSAGKRISGYLAAPTDAGADDEASASHISLGRTRLGGDAAGGGGLPRTFTQQVDEETGGPPSVIDSDDEGTIVTQSHANNGRAEWENRLGQQPWRFSRTEERRRGIFGGGSAYGYEPSIPGGSGGGGVAARRPSRFSAMSGVQGGGGEFARPRVIPPAAAGSYAGNNRASVAPSAMGSAFNYAPDFEAVGADPALAPRPRLNFAQRFLLANDDAVMSIADLWVAAAINGDEAYSAVDDGEGYDDDEYDYADMLDGEGDDGRDDGNDSQVINTDSSFEEEDEDDEGEVGGGSELDGAGEDGSANADETIGPRASASRPRPRTKMSNPRLRPHPHLPPMNFAQRRASRAGSSGFQSARPRSMRLGSFQGRVPSLYTNTGIDMPSPWNEAPSSLQLPLDEPQGSAQGSMQGPGASGVAGKPGAYDPTLAGIPESHSARNTLGRGADASARLLAGSESEDTTMAATAAPAAEKPASPSFWGLLPLVIIAHYGLLAFHSATFDQVFMAFLVTPLSSGGLGLTAAHYAELIAAMALCQIGFQFYFYPKVGPPQGKLSHLAMMRLGTLLYLPTYTLFPLLRNFVHPSTDAGVMSFMILFASMRWLANTCAFTAVAILMNALTPPNLVPLTNGLAQTTSSAARTIGPVVGGMVWAKGIDGEWSEHTWPFNYHEGFWFVGLVAFAGFLHAMFVLKGAAAA